MKIKYDLIYIRNNFCEFDSWYRHNYKKLAPKKRKAWKLLLEMVANMIVIENINKKGYPKDWNKKYIDNVNLNIEELIKLKQKIQKENENKIN